MDSMQKHKVLATVIDNICDLTKKKQSKILTDILYGTTTSDNIFPTKERDMMDTLVYMCKNIEVCTASASASLSTVSVVSSETDVAALCKLYSTVIANKQLKFSSRDYVVILDWLLSCLRHLVTTQCGLPGDHVADALTALGALLYQQGHQAKQHHEVLVNELEQILLNKQFANAWNTRKCAVQCLRNLTMRCGDDNQCHIKEPVLTRMYNIVVQYIQEVAETMEQLSTYYYTSLFSSLCCLENIIILNKSIHVANIGVLLAILKYFMFYNADPTPGLTEYTGSVTSLLYPVTLECNPPVTPSVTTQSQLNRGGNKQRRKKPGGNKTGRGSNNRRTPPRKNAPPANDDEDCDGYEVSQSAVSGEAAATAQPLWSQLSSCASSASGSDVSEDERRVAGGGSRVRSALARVRQAALLTFITCIKCSDRRVVFSYWQYFLPQSIPSHSLLTAITQDTSAKVRSAAAVCLLTLLDGSRPYLSVADELSITHQVSAFTPYSMTVVYMLRELHDKLWAAVKCEQHNMPLIHIIKCVAVLVDNCPYHKLKPGLLRPILQYFKHMLLDPTGYNDANVTVAVLSCIRSMLNVMPHLSEVYEHTGIDKHKEHAASDSEQSTEHTAVDGSWLVAYCMQHVLSPVPMPIRLESIQMLTLVITSHYNEAVSPYYGTITNIIDKCYTEDDQSLRLHITKLSEALGVALLPTEHQTDAITERCVTYWHTLLTSHLSTCVHQTSPPTSPALRTQLCDTLAVITAQLHLQLPRSDQILCLTLLLSWLSVDTDHHVRAAAVRALANYITFPHLQQDRSFMLDTYERMTGALSDQYLVVRSKASWALANYTQILVTACCQPDGDRDSINDHHVSDTNEQQQQQRHYCHIMTTLMAHSDDSDRVTCNIVRAIGNMYTNTITAGDGGSIDVDATVKSVNILIKYTKQPAGMKVRWNACYALGTVLRNQSLITHAKSDASSDRLKQLLDDVVRSLADVMRSCNNYKCRQQAVHALMSACDAVTPGAVTPGAVTPPRVTAHVGSRDALGSVECFTSLVKTVIQLVSTELQPTQGSQLAHGPADHRYREQLLKQVCLLLVSLVRVAGDEDWSALLLPPPATSADSQCAAHHDHTDTTDCNHLVEVLYRHVSGDTDTETATTATSAADMGRVIQLVQEMSLTK